MDDLVALDCAVVEVPSCTGRAATDDGGASESGSRASTTRTPGSVASHMAGPAKRRRKGLLGAIKGEPSTPTSAKVEASGDDLESSNVACRGCGRIQSTGRDFFDPEAPMVWGTSTGRGRWCRECHTLHRTVYSLAHSLGLFSDHLDDPNNRRLWDLHLTAYLTLTKEGAQRITVQMVQQRAETLQWLFQMSGMPLNAATVVPLAEAAARGTPVEPAMLVNMELGGVPCLGVFVQTPPDASAPPMETVFPRPASWPPMFAFHRSRLVTSSDVDRDFLTGKFGVQAPERPEVKLELASPKMTKAEARWAQLRSMALALLQNVAGPKWDLVKESQFTGVVQKISMLHTEFADCGDAALLASVQSWEAGMLAGKRFYGHFRTYNKTKHQISKLLEGAEALRHFHGFVAEAGVTADGRFSLLCMKASIPPCPRLHASATCVKPSDMSTGPLYLGQSVARKHVCGRHCWALSGIVPCPRLSPELRTEQSFSGSLEDFFLRLSATMKVTLLP